MDALKEAGDKGKLIYLRMGGRNYAIPASKAADAAAFITDLKMRFTSTAERRKGGSTPPFSLELSYGANGILVNLDRMEHFSPELSEEFGTIAEDQELASNLSHYMERTAPQFLGVKVDANDIVDQWTADEDEDEE